MTYQDLTKEKYIEFMKFPVDVPLQMLNLLKFKDQVEETGRTGEAQYKHYMKEATPFFQSANASIVFYGKPQFTLIGPSELEWDRVLIVEYTQKADFLKMITTEGYPAQLRRVAIEDSRLIFCSSLL